MPLPEVFLGASVKFLLDKLSTKLSKFEGIHTRIQNWEGMFEVIQAVLAEAEEQKTENEATKVCLDELHDLAYDLDDLLGQFATEQLKQKLDGLIPLVPSSSKVGAFLSRLRPSALKSTYRIKSKMDEISTRLEFFSEMSRKLNLVNINRTSVNVKNTTPPTSSMMSYCCGRDSEKEEIIKYLKSEEEKLGVLPIVGMGGIGKTTLSKAVYNDQNLMNHFHLKAWVCVSDKFDVTQLTKAILDSLRISCPFNTLDPVQVELKKQLTGKKFLIVLDDIWDVNYRDWVDLKSPFSDGAPGSKVIVTTRFKSVATRMRTLQHHNLKLLSNNDCWLVFAKHAFENGITDENPNKVALGRKIADKCKGLPLAAITIGGLLRCKERYDEWEDVLNSKKWEDGEILTILRLSYNHLPAHLKPCFAYCALFPKDYEFTEKELILLWMADGFVPQETGEKQMEDVASEYFDELLSRSFFKFSRCGDDCKLFVMHDLINDLAQEVSGDICIRLENIDDDRKHSRNLKIRYSSYIRKHYECSKKFEILCKVKNSRTFLPLSLRYESRQPTDFLTKSWLADEILVEVFSKLRRVRALSLRGYHVSELPDSFESMKHMRYLDLSFTDIERLSKSVLTLYNLQTLMLIGCKKLQNLPADMGDLINLRLLDVTDANPLTEMPLGIGKMESLHTLSDFIISEGSGKRIRELGKLKHLKGSLSISGLQNVIDALDAKEAYLNAKEKLVVLKIKWGKTSSNLPNEGIESQVLEMLKPHQNLKVLQICGYQGKSFPFWLGDPIFCNIVSIKLENCTNCSSLPPLGQLCSLKRLYVRGLEGVKRVGSEFYGQSCMKPFPALEILHFEDMPQWEDWVAYKVDAHPEIQPFARVNKLSITNCPKLRGVVDFAGHVFPSLTSLSIDGAIVPFRLPLYNEVNSLGSSFLSSLCPALELNEISLSNQKEIGANGFCKLLRIENIPEVIYLTKWFTRELTALENLEIYRCPELRSLFQKDNHEVIQMPPRLPALKYLGINKCPQLVSIFEGEEEEEEEENFKVQLEHEGVQNFMKGLKSLDIEDCGKLQHLPRELYKFTSLVKLNLYDCPTLIYFPESGFPSSLTKLRINKCPVLVSLPETGFPSSMRSLEIYHCDALRSPLLLSNKNNNLVSLSVSRCPSLPRLTSYSCTNRSGVLPSSLTNLSIEQCENLEALVGEGGEDMKIHCPLLTSLEIKDCPRLKCLPNTLHDDSLVKLEKLRIYGCEDLEYLPCGLLSAIIKLRTIAIEDSSKQKALSSSTVEGRRGTRLPSYILKEARSFRSLTNLDIRRCTVDMHPSEWALHRLSSLEFLIIEGPFYVAREETQNEVKVSEFPLEGMLLPPSLTYLSIREFPDLQRLSCRGFESLSSLKHLYIYFCPKLAYFPQNGLPSSLLALRIVRCPVLAKRCQRKKGQYWPIISHIPCVDIW